MQDVEQSCPADRDHRALCGAVSLCLALGDEGFELIEEVAGVCRKDGVAAVDDAKEDADVVAEGQELGAANVVDGLVVDGKMDDQRIGQAVEKLFSLV
ncbi:MAG: hypothetical protein Q4C56_02685 [Peptococcaceae bacterium]|nr:hypothetical protein [Peptococcaceae bacterium]